MGVTVKAGSSVMRGYRSLCSKRVVCVACISTSDRAARVRVDVRGWVCHGVRHARMDYRDDQ